MQASISQRTLSAFRSLSRGVQTATWMVPTAPGGTLKVRVPTICTLRVNAADPQADHGWNAAKVAVHVEPRDGGLESLSQEEATRVSEGFGLRVTGDYEPGKNFVMVETSRESTPASLARYLHIFRTWVGGPFRVRRPQYDSNVLVDVTLPGKYNLDVEVEDGVIDIGSTFEGDVKVFSDYADIKVNRLKSMFLELEAGEGDLEAVVLQGNVSVRSTSGHIDIAKVQGPSFSLRTRDGDVQTRAIYANYTSIRTASGSVRVGGAQGKTKIRTTEGNVEVAGVEGYLDVESDSGDVEARVSMPKNVSLRTRTGDVAVGVPPALSAKVRLEAANEMEVDDALSFDMKEPGSEGNVVKGWVGGNRESLSGAEEPKTIYARALNGDIALRPSQWGGLDLPFKKPQDDVRFPRWAAAFPPPSDNSGVPPATSPSQ